MIGYGLMFSVYMVFLVLPGALSSRVSQYKNQMVSRAASLLIIAYLLFTFDSLIHWCSDLIFMDGLCRINTSTIASDIFIVALVILVLYLCAIYYRRPESYLII